MDNLARECPWQCHRQTFDADRETAGNDSQKTLSALPVALKVPASGSVRREVIGGGTRVGVPASANAPPVAVEGRGDDLDEKGPRMSSAANGEARHGSEARPGRTDRGRQGWSPVPAEAGTPSEPA